MKFILPPLPYPVSALEPIISAEALELHHGAHHQAYVDKLNAALESAGWRGEETIEELLRKLDALPSAIRDAVQKFGGGHANHSLLWETMGPGTSKPTPEFQAHVDRDFGSLAGLRSRIADEGEHLFGSGWIFLAWDERRHCLAVCALPNQDSPYSRGMVPLLPCDVWEHAHYLEYRNRRADWIRDWWYLIDWKHVERRLELVRAVVPA